MTIQQNLTTNLEMLEESLQKEETIAIIRKFELKKFYNDKNLQF